MITSFNTFLNNIKKPFAFSLFMLAKLPSALFAGISIEDLTAHEATISVRYKWFNKNPFRSTYFAILSMAAEVSTGILCMGYLYKSKPPVSMLLTKSEGSFYKKAIGKTMFTCSDGVIISDAINKALLGEQSSVRCHSVGRNADGEVVCEFYFTWSFKARK